MSEGKFYPTAITQNVEYLLDSVQASTMLSNSEFVVMLNQAASDRGQLAKLLNISNEQMSYITNADAGCGLIKYGSALVPFINRFPQNTKLYQLIKILDKAAVASERMKTALVRSKDQAENLMDDGQISPSEYAEDKIRYAAEDVTDQFWHEVSGQTKKAIEKGKEAHREHRNEKRIHKNEERVRRYEEELRRGAPSRTPREEAARQAARQNT